MNTHHASPCPSLRFSGTASSTASGLARQLPPTAGWIGFERLLFDGQAVLGALLARCAAAFAGLGPKQPLWGDSLICLKTPVPVTTREDAAKGVSIDFAGVMAWPMDERLEDLCGQRVIIRRLRLMNDVFVLFELCPRRDFAVAQGPARPAKGGTVFAFSDGALGLWSSFPITVERYILRRAYLCTTFRHSQKTS